MFIASAVSDASVAVIALGVVAFLTKVIRDVVLARKSNGDGIGEKTLQIRIDDGVEKHLRREKEEKILGKILDASVANLKESEKTNVALGELRQIWRAWQCPRDARGGGD